MGPRAWNELRREVFDKNNDCCWVCGVHQDEAEPKQRLEAHELYDINYLKGHMTLREIVGLCGLCHNFIHRRRLMALVDAGKAQPAFLEKVSLHGTRILTRHNPRPWWDVEKQTREMVESRVQWRQWFLWYDGRKHFSRFKNKNDHNRYYERYTP